MASRIEHASIVVLAVLGQISGHFGLRWANEVFHWIPEKSASLVIGGIVLGLAASFVLLWCLIGLIYLADKCGIIDVKNYNKKFPGF